MGRSRRSRLAVVAALLTCGLLVSACSSDEPQAKTGPGIDEPASASLSPSESPSPSGVTPHTGPWIAYQATARDDDGDGEGDGIFLIQTDGENSHQVVTNVPGEEVHPTWSPDGTKLAFVVYSGDSGEVWVADADGGHPHAVTRCRGSCLFYDYAVWMPGHDRLLMARYDGPTLPGTPVPRTSVLALLDLRTKKSRDVATSEPRQLFSSVSVSPDGRRYCAGVEIGDTGSGITGSAIVVGQIARGGATMVTDPQEYGAYCDWHPQANQLVYTTHDLNVFADMAEDSNLYLITPDGSDPQQVTHFATGEKRATQPQWTPDGKRILFTLVQGSGTTRQMATLSSQGDDLQWATGSEPRFGTHPVLQPVR